MLHTEGEELRESADPAHSHRAERPNPIKTVAYRLYLDWLLPASLVIGLYLRTREWLFDKSLWLDELSVAYSITHRGFAGLLRPLSYHQAAPIGWLWAERASIDLFGVSELTLRLPAFVASVVALGVFPLVVRRLVGRSAVPAATLVFATSPALIYYAAETKQYSFDTACVLLALLVTTQLCQRPPTIGWGAGWGLTCAVLVWCSQPAILVCAACGAVLLAAWFRELRTLLPVAIGGAILGYSVVLDWVVALKSQSASTVLQAYWQAYGGYPPLHQTIPADVRWLGAAAMKAEQFLDIGTPALALGVMACGLTVVAFRRRLFQGLLLGLPMVAAVGMAVTDHYPLAQRLALYLYPFAVMLLAAPLVLSERQGDAAARRWRSAAVVASAAALIFVTAPGIALGLDKAIHPDQTADGRQAVAFVSEYQRPGDLVLLDTGAQLNMEFYGPRFHVRPAGLFFFRRSRGAVCRDPFSGLPGVTRVWLVFAELYSDQPLNRNQIYLSQLEVWGKLLRSYTGIAAAGAYLVDLSKPPAHPRAPLSWAAGSWCFEIKLTGHQAIDGSSADR
jgi:hypothetical protein